MRLILDNRNQGFRITLDKDGKLIDRWPKHCCNEHAQQDETTRNNFIATCKRKYNCINVF